MNDSETSNYGGTFKNAFRYEDIGICIHIYMNNIHGHTHYKVLTNDIWQVNLTLKSNVHNKYHFQWLLF